MTSRRTPRLLAAVCVVAIALAAACGSDDTTVAVDDPPDIGDVAGDGEVDLLGFTAADDEPLTGPLYLLPRELELPHEVVSARVLSAAEVDVGGTGTALVLGIPSDTGARELVVVGIEEVENDREVSESERRTLTPVDVNGVEARQTESLLGATVDWFADGRAVGVVTAAGAQDRALAVARALDPAGEGAAVLPTVPDGLTLLAAADVTPETADDIRPALARWTATIRVGAAQLSVDAESTPVDVIPLVVAAVGAGELHTIEVRGATGSWSSRTTSHEGTDDVGIITSTTTTLVWLEHPGYSITISGDVDVDTLVAVAESLTAVDRDTFELHMPELQVAPSSTSLP